MTSDTIAPGGGIESVDKQSAKDFKEAVLDDFRICCFSREASLLGRKEVLTGKAKFGILGDGKEVPQVAMARTFQKGDWRSGYYRDQTIVMALGLGSVDDYFAQLYADVQNDPWSHGRQMNCHFATRTVDENGEWLEQTDLYNVSADISPTAGQMARSLGLALASRLYRGVAELSELSGFSHGGNEVSFVTIGDASTSEGVFWETVNAAAVMKVPLAISVWDDGYGISVPIELQTAKKSISEAAKGFRVDEYGEGILIYTGHAWDYPGLCAMYEEGIRMIRERHIPALFHIKECTQPQGHSTSGSHERYKSPDRLQWEKDADCIKVMGEWIVKNGLATDDDLEKIRVSAKVEVRESRDRAWAAYRSQIDPVKEQLVNEIEALGIAEQEIVDLLTDLKSSVNPFRSDIVATARKLRLLLGKYGLSAHDGLIGLIKDLEAAGANDYHTHLYSENPGSATRVPVIDPVYTDASQEVNGYQVLNTFFDKVFSDHREVVAFGEDLGHIGDVNQGFAGLQEKYGSARIFDTGIREWTIVGQAIGLAMRGIRPIAEIQYLDYLAYGLVPLTDDLATLRYRSAGMQQAPAIIRTRGHRLEGIWHSGSPMGMVTHALRGIHVCVPRNMVQAAGMYRTLLHSNDPGLVIECLNGYRLKERLPENIGEYTVPLGIPEVILEGSDLTIVSYGSVLRQISESAEILNGWGISVEIIDIQTLLPFDTEGVISHSLKKTNRVLFVDEDVPGGATGYMMREVLEVQGGYRYLDSQPQTLTGTAHRPPYGTDGDYFSKPSTEDIVETAINIMHEVSPEDWPAI